MDTMKSDEVAKKGSDQSGQIDGPLENIVALAPRIAAIIENQVDPLDWFKRKSCC